MDKKRILNEIDTLAAMLDGMGAKLRILREEVEKGDPPKEKRGRILTDAQRNSMSASYWGSITKKR